MLTLLLEMLRTTVCGGISGSDVRFFPEQLTLMVMKSWFWYRYRYGKHVHGVFVFLQSSSTYKLTNRLLKQLWIETEGNYCIVFLVSWTIYFRKLKTSQWELKFFIVITITINQCNLNNVFKLIPKLKSYIKLILKQLILYTDLRGMGRVRHAVQGGGKEKWIQDFGRGTEGKRPTRKTRYRWDDNIKSSLKVMLPEAMDWINLALDRDKLQAAVNLVLSHCVS
jgi:hypothetical protein